MGSINTHGFCFDGEDLLKFDTAGSTETGMTFSAEDHRVTAVGTFEAVISEVQGIAKQSALNIVQNTFASFTGSVHFNKPVIVFP